MGRPVRWLYGTPGLRAQRHGCAAARPAGWGVQPVICGPWLGREVLPSLSSPSDSAGAQYRGFGQGKISKDGAKGYISARPSGLYQLWSELGVYFLEIQQEGVWRVA